MQFCLIHFPLPDSKTVFCENESADGEESKEEEQGEEEEKWVEYM